jgi:hypothetical protein
VVRLPIHLKDEHFVYWNEDAPEEELADQLKMKKMLIGYNINCY